MTVEDFLQLIKQADQAGLDITQLLYLEPAERTELLIATRDHYIRLAAVTLEGSAWSRAKQLASRSWRANQPLNKGSSELVRRLYLANNFYRLPGGVRQFHRILSSDIGWYVNVSEPVV